ncbi:hypothetical protein BaRGS_00005951, partial [Batillaria attramentaria]
MIWSSPGRSLKTGGSVDDDRSGNAEWLTLVKPCSPLGSWGQPRPHACFTFLDAQTYKGKASVVV